MSWPRTPPRSVLRPVETRLDVSLTLAELAELVAAGNLEICRGDLTVQITVHR